MNILHIIGNACADPVKTQSGETTIARFNVAVARKFDRDKTDFFRVVAFGKLADVCATYISKGHKVAVSGAIQFSEYEDRDGNKRQGCDLIASDIEFLTPKSDNPRAEKSDALEPVNDDSLPF